MFAKIILLKETPRVLRNKPRKLNKINQMQITIVEGDKKLVITCQGDNYLVQYYSKNLMGWSEVKQYTFLPPISESLMECAGKKWDNWF